MPKETKRDLEVSKRAWRAARESFSKYADIILPRFMNIAGYSWDPLYKFLTEECQLGFVRTAHHAERIAGCVTKKRKVNFINKLMPDYYHRARFRYKAGFENMLALRGYSRTSIPPVMVFTDKKYLIIPGKGPRNDRLCLCGGSPATKTRHILNFPDLPLQDIFSTALLMGGPRIDVRFNIEEQEHLLSKRTFPKLP